MAISKKDPRLNDEIDAKEVRLIREKFADEQADTGEKSEQIGIVSLDEAMEMARKDELDLVEIAPQAEPPVCKLMDYGKFKYKQQKKQHDQRKKSHGRELKELRIRSFRIDPHDLGIKQRKSREFLMEGHRVQYTLMFRSREHDHADLAKKLMLEQIAEPLADISKIESQPRKDGRRMTMTIAPLPNLDKILARRASEEAKAKQSAERLAQLEAEEDAAAARAEAEAEAAEAEAADAAEAEAAEAVEPKDDETEAGED